MSNLNRQDILHTAGRDSAKMASVETLVTQYQHIDSSAARRDGNAALELEVRFENVEYEFFEHLLDEMLKAAGRGSFVAHHAQTLNTIRTERSKTTQGSHQLVWQRTFVDKDKRESAYYQKERLGRPIRVHPTPGVPGYKVVLSQETPTGQFSTNDVRFRVKNRISFTPNAAAPSSDAASADAALVEALRDWSLDLTITRELAESETTSLPEIVREMFGLKRSGRQAPDTILADLGLNDPAIPTSRRLANRHLYHYEVEVEYKGSAGSLTTSRVQTAVGAVLRSSNPDFLVNAQMQNELRDVAAYINESPALLQKFASGEWGLKQLTPQAEAPTRGQYAEIYPPIGFFLTDKAHGLHAICIIRDGRLVIIAPGLETSLAHTEIAGSGAASRRPMLEFYFAGVGQPTIETAVAVDKKLSAAERAKASSLTIIDGEVIVAPDPPSAHAKDAAEGGLPLQFLAFDVIAVRGETMAPHPFEERVRSIGPAAEIAALFGIRARAKPFTHLTSSDPKILAAQFEGMYQSSEHAKSRDYEIDGLMLYGPGESFDKTPIYKWKPFEENSNDFLARRPPAPVLGRYPFVDRPGHKLYFLFVGIAQDVFDRFGMTLCPGYESLFPAHTRRSRGSPGYFPVQFQPSDQPFAYLYQHPDGDSDDIENRIIEMRLATSEGADGQHTFAESGLHDPAPEWVLMRVRADRDEDLKQGRLFGNNYRTAELNWINYRAPFTLEMLSHGPGDAYFQGAKVGIYKAPTNFISTAKSELFKAYLAGMDYVVDLGAGKGQDMQRFRTSQVQTVVMVDKSQDALSELVRRKYSWKRGKRRDKSGSRTRVHVMKADFNDPFETVAQSIRALPGFPNKDNGGANAVVCNLAAHYAFSTETSMVNFVELTRRLVRTGGQVILTLLDGHRVFDLLAENNVGVGQSLDMREGGVLKYSIERRFREKGVTPAGQKIAVLLPFSRGELYEEYLSNIPHLIKCYQNRKFKLCEYRGLWETYQRDFRAQKANFNALTGDDRVWLSLFVVVRLERVG